MDSHSFGGMIDLCQTFVQENFAFIEYMFRKNAKGDLTVKKTN